MRGDKRVAVRFNMAAREASEQVKHEEYVQKFEASDNLKWSLSNQTVATDEKPLGRAATPPTTENGGAAGASAQR
jgi:hypothetical protein